MGFADVAIVGGGPGGLAAANSILKASPKLKVKVFERARRLNPVGNFIGVAENGFSALDAINPKCSQKVSSACSPPGDIGRFKHTGELMLRSPSGFLGDPSHRSGLVPWFDLQQSLLSFLPEDVVERDSPLIDLTVNENGQGVTLHFPNKPDFHASLLIGCDGNISVVRDLTLADPPPKFLNTAIWRGRAPVPEGWFTTYDGFRMCRFTNPDRIWDATLFVVNLGDGFLAWLVSAKVSDEEGQRLAKRYVPDVSKQAAAVGTKLDRCLAHLTNWNPALQELIRSSVPELVTEHGQYCRDPEDCKVWGKGPVTLLGDAAHLGTPFLGQGLNMTLEDAVELGRAIGKSGPTEEALREYENVRRDRALAVQRASIGMFQSMIAGSLTFNEGEWHKQNPWVICHKSEPLVSNVVA